MHRHIEELQSGKVAVQQKEQKLADAPRPAAIALA